MPLPGPPGADGLPGSPGFQGPQGMFKVLLHLEIELEHSQVFLTLTIGLAHNR